MYQIAEHKTQRWLLILSAGLLISLTGCGSSPQSSPQPLGRSNAHIADGNWSIVATSAQVQNQVFTVGGSITQQGDELSGNVHVMGLCEDPSAVEPDQSVPITGTVSGDQFKLKTGPTVAGTVLKLDLNGRGPSLEHLEGTFTASGSCGQADHGSVKADLVPYIGGTWAGVGVPSAGHSGVIIWLSINQAQPPQESGVYPLTGTVTYINASCEADSVPIYGAIWGSTVFVGIDESEQNPVTFIARGSFAPPFTVLSGKYQTFAGGTLPLCGGDQGSINFERQ